MFLINLTICCVVIVEILKCLRIFGEGDVCALVGGYGKIYRLQVVFVGTKCV